MTAPRCPSLLRAPSSYPHHQEQFEADRLAREKRQRQLARSRAEDPYGLFASAGARDGRPSAPPPLTVKLPPASDRSGLSLPELAPRPGSAPQRPGSAPSPGTPMGGEGGGFGFGAASPAMIARAGAREALPLSPQARQQRQMHGGAGRVTRSAGDISKSGLMSMGSPSHRGGRGLPAVRGSRNSGPSFAAPHFPGIKISQASDRDRERGRDGKFGKSHPFADPRNQQSRKKGKRKKKRR